MAGNAGPRCCFGATPLVAELPRSNGQTTAWPGHQRPLRARGRRWPGQAVVCPFLRGSSATRGVAPKQHRGLRRAFSPAFFGLVLFIPWRVGAEESGAAKDGFGRRDAARPARAAWI